MMTRHVKVVNRLGMHARAAARFVEMASGFRSDIQLLKDTKSANGKSILGVMMLAAARGDEVIVTAMGEDEIEASEVLVGLIESGFGEKE